MRAISFIGQSRLKKICGYAFHNTALKRVEIPSSVTEIEPFAFFNCSELTEVVFYQDSQIKEIGHDAFKGTAVKEITVPKSTIVEFVLKFKHFKSSSLIELKTFTVS